MSKFEIAEMIRELTDRIDLPGSFPAEVAAEAIHQAMPGADVRVSWAPGMVGRKVDAVYGYTPTRRVIINIG